MRKYNILILLNYIKNTYKNLSNCRWTAELTKQSSDESSWKGNKLIGNSQIEIYATHQSIVKNEFNTTGRARLIRTRLIRSST